MHHSHQERETYQKGGAALTDEDFLRIAMQTAQKAIKQGDMPFGACIIDERGFVLSAAHNSVNTSVDPTAHAEVQAIRAAGIKLHSPDLRGCMLYATCEPCAMCFAACVWSKLDRIVFAARNEDSAAFAIDCIPISSMQMKHLCQSDVKIVGNVLRDECLKLFNDWSVARNGAQ